MSQIRLPAQGRQFQFLILSYTLLGTLSGELARLAPRIVVLDESHYIKDPKVQCPP